MACPYFYPVEPEKSWTKPPRLPLGDPYNGFCRVDPMREWMPDQLTLRDCCNLGQAREKCARFPKGPGPDAIRFSVTRDQDDVLRIVFVREQNNATLEHGTLEYSSTTEQFLNGSNPSEVIRRQAKAYAESYLRRKSDPDTTAKNPHRR
jgi:hypothetical protein